MKTKLVPGKGRVPIAAYRGKEPYVFVSYAHVDSDRVFEEIRRFNEAGFNVWYDEGIAPGNEWTDEIAEALSNCTVFVIMVTPNSATRINVQNEVNYALDEGKPFLAIHLEKTELRSGMKLRMNSKQAILKYNMSEEEYLWKVTEAFTRMGMPAKGGAAAEAVPPVAREAAPAAQTLPSDPVSMPSGRKRWLLPAVVVAVLLAGVGLYALGPWRGGDIKNAAAVNVTATQFPAATDAPAPTEAAIPTEAPAATETADVKADVAATEAPVEIAAPETPAATETPAVTEVPAETESPKATKTVAEIDMKQSTVAMTAVDALENAETLSAGDVVTFGHYGSEAVAEAIEWIVLETDGASALLLSRYALDIRPYNDGDAAVTWETCTLRQWLNGDFLRAAFAQPEQDALETAAVAAEANPNYSFSDPGSDTRDAVWLLSAGEVERCLPDAAQRVCLPSGGGDQAASWWLRTPGYGDDKAMTVSPDGALIYRGEPVSQAAPVRPVIRLRLRAGEDN